ncbi:MAG: hypothetical protein HYU88_06885 [Chloroflexi bacterium]|nr:hypothetical protein [Chloroflexota bacterium]
MRRVKAPMVRAVVWLLAATVVALGGSACLPEATPTPTAAPAPVGVPAKQAGKPEGTVTVGFHTFSKEIMDPSLDGATGLIVYGQIFDWWIGTTPAGKLDTAYGVVESYKPSPDAKVWTFTLKKGIKWHDGVEMSSDDMKWTLEYYSRAAAICTMCGTVKANLDRVEIVDRYTARLHLKRANVNIPAEFAPLEGDLKMLPKHYFEKVGADAFAQKPLGSGPWKFVGRGLGQFIEYEANTEYWNPSRVPGFAKLRLLLVPEARTRVAMLKRGEVDLISVDSQDVEPPRRPWATR